MKPVRDGGLNSSAKPGLLGLGRSVERYREKLPLPLKRSVKGARHLASVVYKKIAGAKDDPWLPSHSAADGYSEIADFLGLGIAEEWKHEMLLVSLEKILEGASTLQDVQDNVIKLITTKTKHSGTSKAEGRLLVWIQVDYSYHSHISQIESLLAMEWPDVLRFTGKNYLRGRRRGNPESVVNPCPPVVAVHLRIGDSLYVDTPCGCLILHGSCHFSSVADFVDKVRTVDPGRSPWFDPYQISFLIERELKERKIPSDSVYLVSDGFESARVTIDHIKPDEIVSIDLLVAARRRVEELEKQFHQAFQWVPKDRLVLGEGHAQTLEAVKIFTFADTILCNNGGFSNVLHYIYKSEESDNSFVFLNRERVL
jgi:hypothetical protein